MSDKLSEVSRDIREIYTYRSILRSLILKNLFGKYRNSFLGFAWNFITPIILLLMYYIVFSEIRGGSSIDNAWIFISSTVFIFHYMTHCITGGVTAFINNASTLKKMYIPKEIIVLSNSISNMIVCIIGNIIVIITLLITSYPIYWEQLLVLPIILFLAFLFGTGCIFLLSTITVYVRDLQYILSSLTLVFFILTPMRYMASEATGLMGNLIWYNPLTYYIEVTHDILYWGRLPTTEYFVICIIISIVVLFLGYLTYRLLKHGIVKRL